MKMTRAELNKILGLHRKWLDNTPEGIRLRLCDVNLSDADLPGANLPGANLPGVNLSGADLYNANLSNADLSDVNLSVANLHSADLYNANLNNADLSDVNLSVANLHSADLYNANLSNADLSNANLSGANLHGADLYNAELVWVNWHEAKGLKVYEAQLNSSRENAQLVYIPSLDVATTGCWQASWKDTKERVDKVYKNTDASIYKKYQLAFKYIEAQMIEDN